MPLLRGTPLRSPFLRKVPKGGAFYRGIPLEVPSKRKSFKRSLLSQGNHFMRSILKGNFPRGSLQQGNAFALRCPTKKSIVFVFVIYSKYFESSTARPRPPVILHHTPPPSPSNRLPHNRLGRAKAHRRWHTKSMPQCIVSASPGYQAL